MLRSKAKVRQYARKISLSVAMMGVGLADFSHHAKVRRRKRKVPVTCIKTLLDNSRKLRSPRCHVQAGLESPFLQATSTQPVLVNYRWSLERVLERYACDQVRARRRTCSSIRRANQNQYAMHAPRSFSNQGRMMKSPDSRLRHGAQSSMERWG